MKILDSWSQIPDIQFPPMFVTWKKCFQKQSLPDQSRGVGRINEGRRKYSRNQNISIYMHWILFRKRSIWKQNTTKGHHIWMQWFIFFWKESAWFHFVEAYNWSGRVLYDRFVLGYCLTFGHMAYTSFFKQ